MDTIVKVTHHSSKNLMTLVPMNLDVMNETDNDFPFFMVNFFWWFSWWFDKTWNVVNPSTIIINFVCFFPSGILLRRTNKLMNYYDTLSKLFEFEFNKIKIISNRTKIWKEHWLYKRSIFQLQWLMFSILLVTKYNKKYFWNRIVSPS